MPAKPNKLRRLAGQFRAQPRQTELLQLKVQFTTIADKVEGQADVLREAIDRLAALRKLQEDPTLLQGELRRQLNVVRDSVQKLQLLAQTDKPASGKVNTPLDAVIKASDALMRDIEQGWNNAIDAEVDSTQAFIALTGAYDPVAQRALQQALDRFKAAGVGVGSRAGVKTYSEARQALVQARKSLNIPGTVGEFLQSALHGKGSPRMLSDPQVQSFLDQHPVLWTKLSVRLG